MRPIILSLCTVSTLLLSACISKGPNPDDPYESINRSIYRFNVEFDRFILKPPAQAYRAIVPSVVRTSVNNAYNNINMLPTVANDLLQAEWNHAIKDTWRFIINSTLGIGGLFDPASTCQLPIHGNDLGLTFAKWGDKKSPYVMLPLLGPSTIRDGMGLLFDFSLFTPYPYIPQDTIIYSILGFRYVDLRSQFLDTEKLMDQSLDKYAFIRDAYLQNRNYRINGIKEDPSEALYVDDDHPSSLNLLAETPSTPPTPNDGAAQQR